MATNVATGVALSLGLITASVSVQSARPPKTRGTGNVMVCDAGHDAAQITQPPTCPDCGPVPYQQLKKARPVDGGLVVLEAEEISEAAVDVLKYKKRAAVTAHPAEQVEALTAAGEKFYYLLPDAGHEAAYGTLLALVVNHPELAFVTQWTPRSAMGQFRLMQYEGALCFQERTNGSGLRDAPSLDLEVNAQLVAMAEQVLKLTTAPYDPETYRDTYEERIAAIVAGKTPVAATKESTSALPVDDLMERLRAQLEELDAPKKTPRRKPAAKKKVTA